MKFFSFIIIALIFLFLCLQTGDGSPVSQVGGVPVNPVENEIDNVENYTLAPGASKLEKDALDFVKDVNRKSMGAYNKLAQVSWNYETNLTEATESERAKAEAENYKFEAEVQDEVAKRFPLWEDFDDRVLKRMFSNFAIQGPGNMSKEHIEKMTKILTKMETAYATTTICDYKDKKKCDLRLDRDINKKLSSSHDWDERVYYWTEWHNAMSKAVPPKLYETFVGYQNEMAQANDFSDMGEMWITQYADYNEDWTADMFKDEIKSLEEEIRPIYNKLHAYIRMKLKRVPMYANKISKEGYLPVQMLGNMWGQDWINLDHDTKPHPGHEITSVRATEALKKAGYTVERMFREADKFFSDLGLLSVPESFWTKSRFERPKDGREVVCHPSAWDFSYGSDVRITMCGEVTLDDLMTAHHEMGHIQYYLQYRHLPHVFQDGANPGFHEAIGDSIALSIMTPTHLQCKLKLDLGLGDICNAKKTNGPISDMEMNFLYITALQKLPFPLFSYALETWRWKAFNLSIKADDYNKEWWRLRAEIQGVIPPSDRNSPDLFDPSSKFHIVANEPYISYFVSSILQFQFYEAMCKAANQFDEKSPSAKPLYRCDISGSKAAGKLLEDMMKLGCSTDWRTALKLMTGSMKLSAKPMLDYFEPLFTYIDKELKEGNEPACYGHFCHKN